MKLKGKKKKQNCQYRALSDDKKNVNTTTSNPNLFPNEQSKRKAKAASHGDDAR